MAKKKTKKGTSTTFILARNNGGDGGPEISNYLALPCSVLQFSCQCKCVNVPFLLREWEKRERTIFDNLFGSNFRTCVNFDMCLTDIRASAQQ